MPEHKNPLNRLLIFIYRPAIHGALRFKAATMLAALAILAHEGGRAAADAGQDHQIFSQSDLGLGKGRTRVERHRSRSDRDVRDRDQPEAGARMRPGMTVDGLIAEMDKSLQFPGVSNAWTMP